MYGLRIKSLKDDARILGLVLRVDHELDLDVTAEQLAAVKSAVDSKDIAILRGGEALAPVVAPVIEFKGKVK